MLTRVISAIVMLAIAVPLLIIGGEPFEIFMVVLSVLGLYELIHMREEKKKFPFLLKVFAYLLVMFFTVSNLDSIDFSCTIDYRVMAFIIFVFLASMVFIKDKEKYGTGDALFLVGSILLVGLSFNLMILIRNYGLAYIIYLLLITTMTDTFALFTGMFIGKNKLAKTISPNKTIEGFIGGGIMGTFIATSFYTVVINPSVPLVLVIFVTFILSSIGQLGDLAFSFIKREYGKKDFSNLIPGHGGILDRLDSIIFVVLAFVLLFGLI